MRVNRILITFTVVLGLVALAAQSSVATQPRIPQYFDYTLVPKSLPDKAGPVELAFSFKMKPEYECDSVLVQVAPWKGLVYDGPSEFWASLAETGEYSTTLSVTVPPNDTSALKMRLSCQSCIQSLRRVFITTGDAITVLDNVPTPLGPEPVRRRADRYLVRSGPGKETRSIRSGLTEEQLQAKQTVAVGLGEADDYGFAEGLIGSIPDSALIPGTRGAYLLDISLDHILRMMGRGIEVDWFPEQTELVFRQDTRQADKALPTEASSPQPPRKSRTEQYWEQFGLTAEMLEDRNSLTEAQLQTMHTVVIGLGDADDYAFAESLLGPIPDSAEIPGMKGGFILDITLDHLLRLSERGIEIELESIFRKQQLERKQRKSGDDAPAEEGHIQGSSDVIYRSQTHVGDANPDEWRGLERQEPLRGYSGEIFRTDSMDYVRHEGETTFRPVTFGMDYEQQMSPMMTFLDTVDAGTEFDVVIDLRDPDDKATADRLLGKMLRAERNGWYCATVDKRMAQALLRGRLVFAWYSQTDRLDSARERELRSRGTEGSNNEDVSDEGLYPTPDDITVSDISMLVDYLFVTGPSLGLDDCY